MPLPQVSSSSARSSALTCRILHHLRGIHKCLEKGRNIGANPNQNYYVFELIRDKGYESLFLHFISIISYLVACASHLQLLLATETSLVLHSTTSFITFKRKYEPCLMVQFIGNYFSVR